MNKLLVLEIVAIMTSCTMADEIELNDGRKYEGAIVKDDDKTLSIQVKYEGLDVIITVNKTKVKSQKKTEVKPTTAPKQPETASTVQPKPPLSNEPVKPDTPKPNPINVDLPKEVQDAVKRQEDAVKTLGIDKEFTLDMGNKTTLKLVLIPAGKFMMGSPESEKNRRDNEGPQHEVTLTKPFYMGVYEVTQEQYQTVCGINPSNYKGNNLPVEQVSLDDAAQFCAKLSNKLGGLRGISIPTEAQWEYACRAGSTAPYCYGDDENKLSEYAFCIKDKDEPNHQVGQKKPNAFGLYDMHGNVQERCKDNAPTKYDASSAIDPNGSANDSWLLIDNKPVIARIVRCGVDAATCRSAYRSSCSSYMKDKRTGFRIIVDVETVKELTDNKTIFIGSWDVNTNNGWKGVYELNKDDTCSCEGDNNGKMSGKITGTWSWSVKKYDTKITIRWATNAIVELKMDQPDKMEGTILDNDSKTKYTLKLQKKQVLSTTTQPIASSSPSTQPKDIAVIFIVNSSGSTIRVFDYYRRLLMEFLGISDDKRFTFAVDVPYSVFDVHFIQNKGVYLPSNMLLSAEGKAKSNRLSAFEFARCIVPEGSSDPILPISKAIDKLKQSKCNTKLIVIIGQDDYDYASNDDGKYDSKLLELAKIASAASIYVNAFDFTDEDSSSNKNGVLKKMTEITKGVYTHCGTDDDYKKINFKELKDSIFKTSETKPSSPLKK